MESIELESRIKASLPNSEIQVEGRDCDFTVTVISDDFESLPRIKRQQQILSCFSEELTQGEIHALSVKTFTINEWTKSKENALTQLTPI